MWFIFRMFLSLPLSWMQVCENGRERRIEERLTYGVIGNQAMVIRAIEFDHLYYEQSTNGVKNYPYPFKNYAPNDRDYDYLDYARYSLSHSPLLFTPKPGSMLAAM
jgi:hypothetical protein